MKDWENCLKLNVLAPMALTHAFSPGMVERKVALTSLQLAHISCIAQWIILGTAQYGKAKQQALYRITEHGKKTNFFEFGTVIYAKHRLEYANTCYDTHCGFLQDGLIVNIGSIAGLEPMKSTPVYAASKWGLRGWSLSNYEASPSRPGMQLAWQAYVTCCAALSNHC